MKLNIRIAQPVIVFCTLVVLSLVSGCRAASLTIAVNGKSVYSIVVPQVAAKTVNDAATEMQLDIAKATGAKLPIVKDNATISGPFISLGSTKQAQAAKISADKIPPDGFRIVTNNGNLFIIGLDTTTVNLNREERGRTYWHIPDDELHPEIPGPAFTENGGYSHGTANGVYTFLQEKLDVRWLMPGEIGRDVPARERFQVEEMDLTQTPDFMMRVIYYLQSSPAAVRWQDHQRLGFSQRVSALHSWSTVVPLSLYDQHPEWFAMDTSGHRPKPTRKSYKLETTNPELVKHFAKEAIKALKANPQLNNFSLSPTDSGGWSQSPESKPYYDPPPPGEYGQSATRLVMKFYNDVSAIVAKEYPQGQLSGYIYGDYTFVPPTGGVKFPDNFIPMHVFKGNGYAMYRPENREFAISHIKDWAPYLPKTWVFYTHPLWQRSSEVIAMVTPAAPETLNAMFSAYVKYNASGGHIYGTSEWGASALKNYILAQMLWNPQADAREIQHEWLMRAYGPNAGPIVEEFYNKMDAHWFSDRIRSGAGGELLRSVYGAHYPQMEELLLKAWNQPMTAQQKERLGLIREQMIVLQFILRNKGYLPADYASPWQADAKQVFQLVTADHEAFNHFANSFANFRGRANEAVKVQLASAATKPEAKSAPIPNASAILLFPTQAGEVTLRPTKVDLDSSLILYALQDKDRRHVDQGMLFKGQDIVFNARANEPYYLSLMQYGPRSSTVEWQISIPQSTAASKAAVHDGVVNLYPDKAGSAPLYVYVPEKLTWQMETDAAGVTVGTPTDAQKNSTKNYLARKAAKAALDLAQERYQAELWDSLNHGWRFQTDPDKSGEEQGFDKAGFNDNSWKRITAIGSWQDQGFDYHGTAWYRETFNPFKAGDEPLTLAGRRVLLFFGAVDGDAVFYLNGQKVGEHKMIDPSTSWQVPVVFDVTDIINPTSNNTLAVKVTKDRLASGIYKGVSLLVGTLPEK